MNNYFKNIYKSANCCFRIHRFVIEVKRIL